MIKGAADEGISLSVPSEDVARNAVALSLMRGVARLLGTMGYSVLYEFTLKGGRRVDVIGINRSGHVIVAEVKSSVADFRSDGKWPSYLDHCDEFYFAVAQDFPNDLLPDDTGLIIADNFGGAIVRPSQDYKLNGARRRALTLKFARAAADRLLRQTDPTLVL